MPSTTPVMSVVADIREHAEVPLSGTPALADDDHCRRTRSARAFFTRRRARRVKRPSSYYDPLFGRPDFIENDYYRFLHHPCD